MPLLYRAFAPLLFVLVLTSIAVAGPAAEDTAKKAVLAQAEKVFDESMALFHSKSYEAALEGFERAREVLEEHAPASPRMVEALFHEAECLYFTGEKQDAHERYRRILDEHKNFPKIAEVINREYEIGSAFIEGKAEKSFLFFSYESERFGAEILEYLIQGFQQKYFDYALYQVADYYFRSKDFRRAADAYMALEEQFPESPWSGVAQYQRALCYLNLSRGYRYDPTPIFKAEEVLLDYVKKNPAGNRIREAEKALESIRADRAKLYAENAEFYLFRERRPRSALVYVEAILREAPDSPSAEEVPTLLARVAERAGERDPKTHDRAKELLAELDRLKAAPSPSAPVGPGLVAPGQSPIKGAAGSGGPGVGRVR